MEMKKEHPHHVYKQRCSLCKSHISIHGMCCGKWRGMWVYLNHKRLGKVCMRVIYRVCDEWPPNWKGKPGLPEQIVSVSVATTEKQPGLAKCCLRVLLPLVLPESQTTDVSGQSIPTDDQTRWRRGSPFSQQRLKKSCDTIKHCLQWQYTECHNCLMHGNGCACCSKHIICIIKFHHNRRIDPITINSYWKWNWGSVCVCVQMCNVWVLKKKHC